MFDVGPSDLAVLNFLLICSFIVSVIVYFISKKKILLAIFIMSVLSNLSVYLMANSIEFALNDLLWLIGFSFEYWPIINIIFFIFLITRYILKLKSQKND